MSGWRRPPPPVGVTLVAAMTAAVTWTEREARRRPQPAWRQSKTKKTHTVGGQPCRFSPRVVAGVGGLRVPCRTERNLAGQWCGTAAEAQRGSFPEINGFLRAGRPHLRGAARGAGATDGVWATGAPRTPLGERRCEQPSAPKRGCPSLIHGSAKGLSIPRWLRVCSETPGAGEWPWEVVLSRFLWFLPPCWGCGFYFWKPPWQGRSWAPGRAMGAAGEQGRWSAPSAQTGL